MRGSYTVLLTTIIAVLSVSAVFGQGFGINPDYTIGIRPEFLEFNLLGGGGRAAGMGGAYLGISDGEMGFSWNPAAMVSNDKTKFGVQFGSIADKFNSSFLNRGGSLYTFDNFQPIEIKREHFSLNYGGFVIPFEFMDMDWAAGGGFRNVLDMVGEFNSVGFNSSSDSYKQDRGVDAASLALSWRFIDQISLGLTVNDYMRNSESNVYYGDGFGYSTQSGDTSIVDLWINQNSHFSGVNVDLGLAADYGMVKGGFVFHTPLDLKQDVKLTQYIIVPPVPDGSIDRVTVKYNLPYGISAGLAANPVEKLTVAVDLSLRSLSSVEMDMNWERTDIPDTTIDLEWQDLTQFRIGAEYVLDAGFADIPVRAGFRNEPSPSREVLSITNGVRDYGSQITTNIITFGTGLYFDRSWLDFAYQMGSSSYNQTVDYGTPQTFEIKRDYSRLIMSIGMYF